LKTIDFSGFSVSEVAGLLKFFLKSLSDPIFPVVTIDAFLDIPEILGRDEQLKRIKAIWKALPLDNKRSIEYIFDFFKELLTRSAVNGLHSIGISTIFVPTMLWTKQLSIEYTLQIPKLVNIVKLIIDNYTEIMEVNYFSTTNVT
jgi:hypothetical protein